MEPETFSSREEAIRFFAADPTGDDADGFVDAAVQDGRIVIKQR